MKKIITSLGILSLIVSAVFWVYLGDEGSDINESLITSISALDIFEMENEVRIEEDVTPLVYSDVLSAAAQSKANYMAWGGYFAHTSPDGVPFWHWVMKFGYDYLYAGENLAVKFKTSEGVLNAWMDSEGHRNNILDEGFEETGIGIARGVYKGVETEFVVQLFGSEMPSFEN